MPRRLFTAAEFTRMGEVGILDEDDRVELIAGEILEMAPITIQHAQCVNRLNRILARALPDDFQVSPQNPIQLSDISEPSPDVAVLHDRDYGATPTAPDILFVIEVSDTTQDYDRGTKMPLYAAAGVAEVWLIDLVSERIERYTDPQDGRYRVVRFASRGESLASTTIPALVIDANAILGKQHAQ